MEEFSKILRRYEVYNCFVPGVVFVFYITKTTSLNVIEIFHNTPNVFMYVMIYFVGMVISRIGSLFIERFLKYLNFIKFVKYSFYLKAEKLDKKMEFYSEINNVYRSLAAVFILSFFVQIIEVGIFKRNICDQLGTLFVSLMLSALFVCSYQKQTNYIRKRAMDIND